MNIAQAPERYLTQKELVVALDRQFGLTVSERYIRVVKSKSIERNDGLFVSNCARASEVYAWLRANPRFSSNSPGIG